MKWEQLSSRVEMGKNGISVMATRTMESPYTDAVYTLQVQGHRAMANGHMGVPHLMRRSGPERQIMKILWSFPPLLRDF